MATKGNPFTSEQCAKIVFELARTESLTVVDIYNKLYQSEPGKKTKAQTIPLIKGFLLNMQNEGLLFSKARNSNINAIKDWSVNWGKMANEFVSLCSIFSASRLVIENCNGQNFRRLYTDSMNEGYFKNIGTLHGSFKKVLRYAYEKTCQNYHQKKSTYGPLIDSAPYEYWVIRMKPYDGKASIQIRFEIPYLFDLWEGPAYVK